MAVLILRVFMLGFLISVPFILNLLAFRIELRQLGRNLLHLLLFFSSSILLWLTKGNLPPVSELRRVVLSPVL